MLRCFEEYVLICSETLERALGTHTPVGIQYLISEWKEVLDKRNEHTLAAQYNIVSFAQCLSLRVDFMFAI